MHHSPSASSITATFLDDPLPSRFCPTMHFGRVASVDRHDTDAWTQERKLHDTGLHAAAGFPSLGFNGPSSGDYLLVDDLASGPALMPDLAKLPRTMEHTFSTNRSSEDTVHIRDRTPTPLICPNVTVGLYPLEGLSNARPRVGEILVRCGVIDCSGVPSIEPDAVACRSNSRIRHVNGFVLSTVPTNGGHLITALANWTSEWLHTLVVQPYAQGSFRYQYQGTPGTSFVSVAPRIRRILFSVENPVQVVIHALWFIGTLTANGTYDNTPFLSVPIFRYLHNNGTVLAEDFMLRTFVACAMISDKIINDTALSAYTWNRLTHIPPAILNAAEKHTLSCLQWNVVMTGNQWQDIIIYLRSCIKMGSAFDPFTYDVCSSSGTMARYLDELIDFCNSGETGLPLQGAAVADVFAPQPAQFSTGRAPTEWCPEDDPIVNQKPRTIGIAPGADQNSSTLWVGTTAKDILESILGSSSVPHLAHLAQPAGTSFCGSFGVIGARLAHTIKTAGTCQSASWIASHG